MAEITPAPESGSVTEIDLFDPLTDGWVAQPESGSVTEIDLFNSTINVKVDGTFMWADALVKVDGTFVPGDIIEIL